MLRRLTTAVGVALAIFGGMASVPGAAQADTFQNGIWVFIKWYQVTGSMQDFMQCDNDAATEYPGHDWNCRFDANGTNTVQLWVRF